MAVLTLTCQIPQKFFVLLLLLFPWQFSWEPYLEYWLLIIIWIPGLSDVFYINTQNVDSGPLLWFHFKNQICFLSNHQPNYAIPWCPNTLRVWVRCLFILEPHSADWEFSLCLSLCCSSPPTVTRQHDIDCQFMSITDVMGWIVFSKNSYVEVLIHYTSEFGQLEIESLER